MNLNLGTSELTCPCPSDIVSKLTTFFSMENLTSPDMGSDPGDRMKMRGEQQLLSLYDFSRSKGGGSMKGGPILLTTYCWTSGISLSGRMHLS